MFRQMIYTNNNHHDFGEEKLPDRTNSSTHGYFYLYVMRAPHESYCIINLSFDICFLWRSSVGFFSNFVILLLFFYQINNNLIPKWFEHVRILFIIYISVTGMQQKRLRKKDKMQSAGHSI